MHKLTTGIFRQDYSDCILSQSNVIQVHMIATTLFDKLDAEVLDGLEVIEDLHKVFEIVDYVQEVFAKKLVKSELLEVIHFLLNYKNKHDLTHYELYDILFSVNTKFSFKLNKFKVFLTILIPNLEKFSNEQIGST